MIYEIEVSGIRQCKLVGLCQEGYNKKGQLSLTNLRDACETFARFM